MQKEMPTRLKMLKTASVKKYPFKCSDSEPLRSSFAFSSLARRLRVTKFVGTLAAETKNSAMSKRNALLGTASGKLGDTIYYRRKGQQASRTYRASIKKSDAYLSKLNRAKLRNGINYYKSLQTADLSPLIEVSRYGYMNNRIAKESILHDIVIIRQRADEGNAFPFNFVSDILPVNGLQNITLEDDSYSGTYIPSLHTGIRVAGNPAPTTVASLYTYLTQYNSQIRQGDYLALYASTIPEQLQDMNLYAEPMATPIPTYAAVKLDPNDTRTLAVALPGFTIGYYQMQSSVYGLRFFADVQKLYSTTAQTQNMVWQAMAIYRLQSNGRKQVLFRTGRESAALKELLSYNRVNPYRQVAIQSY